MKQAILIVLLILISSILTISCMQEKGKKHPHRGKEDDDPKKTDVVMEKKVIDTVRPGALECDTALWRYVYNPERLIVMQACKTVTGIIEETNADEDGDQHMLLKLDDGQDNLLTKKNIKKKQGDLVIEAVCINTVGLKKVGRTCDGYLNKIRLPKLGDHVRVTGSLVNDTHNGWNEIHPITNITVLH